MISPLYGINPAQAENPYFFLYLIQDLNDVIMSYKFRGVIILEGEDLGAKEVNERRSEGQKGGPRGYSTSPRGPTQFRLRGPVCIDPSPRSILVTQKCLYKRSPDVLREGSHHTRETRNIETEGCCRRRSEGGNAAGIHLRRAPPPPA